MTDTRIQIELAPFKLRPRGSRTYEVLVADEVIGELTAFRRLVGRKPQTHYVVRSANGGMLGTRDSVDDAADLAYAHHVQMEGPVAALYDQALFVSRLYAQGILDRKHTAVLALVVWSETHGFSLNYGDAAAAVNRAIAELGGR